MPQVDVKLLEDNVKYWEDRYLNNKIEWHIDDVNPMLLKHFKTLIPDSNPKKIFLPLCGKTKDIPFLLSLGHEVFGVEIWKLGIEELNDEHNLGLKFNKEKSLYESEDGKLKIYCGDFFTCPPIENWGPFDVIWDRGSFIAIDYPLREAYVEIMKRAVGFGTGHKFRYLLQSVRYDKNSNPGPPRNVDTDDIVTFFEPWASVEELEKYELSENALVRQVSGIKGQLFEIPLLLTNKN